MRLLRALSALMVLTAVATSARAGGVAYSENFNEASPNFSADPFWLDNTVLNGFVVPNTNVPALSPFFGGEITADVEGNGNFLFDGTAGPGVPSGQDKIFISPTFTVAANTLYTVSFYLTSANGINSPQVQADIDGMLIGSVVSPVGDYNSSGWQQFTATWNSGNNTSATLTLHNSVTTTTGNDFGVDTIVVSSAVPEPSTFSMAVVGLLGLVGYARLRRKPRS